MQIICQKPEQIKEVACINDLIAPVQEGLAPITKWVCAPLIPKQTYQFSPRLFHPHLAVQTGETAEKINAVELSYSTDVIVMGRHGLIKPMGDQALAFLHPFYDVDQLCHPTKWQSDYVRSMKLTPSNLKVIGAAMLQVIKPINIYQTIEHPVFLLGTPADDNYSHFVWDTLPQLWYVKQLHAAGIAVKLLVDKTLSGYKLEFLAALGFDQSQLIMRPIHKQFLCKQLFMGTRLGVNNRKIADQGLALLSALRQPAQTQTRRIFLDRNDDRKAFRQLLNEEDLWEICQRYGFERLTPGRMSLAQKQQVYAEAECLIGQYGGGLQNHFLCHPHTKILVLQSHLFVRNIFDFTQQSLQTPVVSVVGQAYYTGCNSINNSHFMVDERLFEDALVQLLTTDLAHVSNADFE